MDNVKKHSKHIAGALVGGSFGWYLPVASLAFIVAYMGVKLVCVMGERAERRQTRLAPVAPAVHRVPVQRVDSVDGMLLVPVRPVTRHEHHAAA
jgi:hypothetical protein